MKRNFLIISMGSFTAITCKTKRAKRWVNDNLYFEEWQVQGGNTIMIDCRMAEDIIPAIEEEFN